MIKKCLQSHILPFRPCTFFILCVYVVSLFCQFQFFSSISVTHCNARENLGLTDVHLCIRKWIVSATQLSCTLIFFKGPTCCTQNFHFTLKPRIFFNIFFLPQSSIAVFFIVIRRPVDCTWILHPFWRDQFDSINFIQEPYYSIAVHVCINKFEKDWI